jgi:FkbM family methyltransferase
VEGFSGLSFLREILTEGIYDFKALRADNSIRVIFDAGANCGFFALTESALNPAVKIVCFEPHPRTVERLRDNIRVNQQGDRIEAIHAAVGATNGTCEINTANESSMAVVTTSQTQYVPAEKVVSVRLVTLDTYAAEKNIWPDLLKVDVEGFEVEVLRGATECLKRLRHVVLEYHNPSLLAECQSILKAAGFEVTCEDSRHLTARKI